MPVREFRLLGTRSIVHTMISVIIPTLNAEQDLPRCFSALVPAVATGLLKEVIVADGGSEDATAGIAEECGAVLISAPKGRGSQLAAGAEVARGDWLLFLHSDTVLGNDWEAEVACFIDNEMTSGLSVRAAHFRFALDDPGFMPRIMERGVAFRSRALGLPYGDQGLLIKRSHYQQLGGFRSLPLMEDVDIVRRIGRRRLASLRSSALTSAIRYRRDGYVRRILTNLTCLTLYFFRVPPARLARFYG